jgi:ATP-GRASP peptide maturase of grasp-with-spasm system
LIIEIIHPVLNPISVICLFSNSVDNSTTHVIRWLNHLGKKEVIRINSDDDRNENPVKIDLVEGDFCFQQGADHFRLKDIEIVWYRKGLHWFCDQYYPVTIQDHAKFTSYLNRRLKMEEAKLSDYLHFLIKNTIPALGTYGKTDLNKLVVLAVARQVGLKVPEFYITNHKDGVNRALEQAGNAITKPMSDGLYLFEKEESGLSYFSYTETVGKESTKSLPESISPSFLQKNIKKQYELRIFFLEDCCYSMAIHSQSDERTQTDFRKYNEEKPNRFVPYLLPEETDLKIKALFQKLGLNTGSVDMIVDEEGEYYFLEINPVGQFGMVSSPCNYHLEEKVALYLLKHAKEKGTYQPAGN